jgi:hypothetical protein
MDAEEYCREIEAYLCRRNEGHLVRLVGPAFEKVCEWVRLGIPLKVACHGIDRHVERQAAKGPRRRPLRIEFCEADVLDAFDAWRRAVGLRDQAADPDGSIETTSRPAKAKRSLPAHLDRVIARLTAVRAGAALASEWDAAIQQAMRELDRLRPGVEKLRGPAREAITEELATVDTRLLLAESAREAELELRPFESRLSPDGYATALRACRDRILRQGLGLPVIVFD